MTLSLGPQFDDLAQRFSKDKEAPLAVAVSGGSDSTALLHLTADWAARTGRKLIVLTVDHQLRAASADEARSVESLAKTLGAHQQTLIWKTPRGGQNAARDARHRLLAEAARQAGASALLLGHTLDDVIETVHIREKRETPADRLAGPVLAAPSPVWPEGRGLTLLRPLIWIRRQDLRDWLSGVGRSWIDDPSNENDTYERIEVRNRLAEIPVEDESRASRAVELLDLRHQADLALGGILADDARVRVEASGLVQIGLDELPGKLRAHTLAVIARVCGGHDRTPRAEAVHSLLGSLVVSGDRATLGGAWFQRSADRLLVGRDPGEARARVEGGLWDGRYVQDESSFQEQEIPFLLRQSMPPGAAWREILSERIALEAKIYQTPLVNPVQR